jgi:hypothetical protein
MEGASGNKNPNLDRIYGRQFGARYQLTFEAATICLRADWDAVKTEY